MKSGEGKGGDLAYSGKGRSACAVDIAFVIDRSGSMRACIETIKNDVLDFISSLSKNKRVSTIDWRIAFVAFNEKEFYVQKFTDNVSQFKAALSSLDIGGSELTLPAIDIALDFPWRTEAHRAILVFTDEPLEGGDKIELQLSKYEELLGKFLKLSVRLFFFGARCPHYKRFELLPNSYIRWMDLHLGILPPTDFLNILKLMGRELSGGLASTPRTIKPAKKDLYQIEDHVAVHLL
jgi:hypothetical protein